MCFRKKTKIWEYVIVLLIVASLDVLPVTTSVNLLFLWTMALNSLYISETALNELIEFFYGGFITKPSIFPLLVYLTRDKNQSFQ